MPQLSHRGAGGHRLLPAEGFVIRRKANLMAGVVCPVIPAQTGKRPLLFPIISSSLRGRRPQQSIFNHGAILFLTRHSLL